MNAFVGGAALGILGALGWLKACYPNRFAAIFAVTKWAGVALVVAAIVWDGAASVVYSQLIPLIADGQVDKAKATVDAIRIITGERILVGTGIAIYLVALKALFPIPEKKSPSV